MISKEGGENEPHVNEREKNKQGDEGDSHKADCCSACVCLCEAWVTASGNCMPSQLKRLLINGN